MHLAQFASNRVANVCRMQPAALVPARAKGLYSEEKQVILKTLKAYMDLFCEEPDAVEVDDAGYRIVALLENYDQAEVKVRKAMSGPSIRCFFSA